MLRARAAQNHNDWVGLKPGFRRKLDERPVSAVRVACKNFVDRNLTLSVCDHSSVALTHISNSVKSASFSKVPKAIWDSCRLPMHSPALSVVSLGGKQTFAAVATYVHR